MLQPNSQNPGLGSWALMTELKAPPNSAGFGTAVAADGQTGVVGSYGDDSDTGAAYVYVKSSSNHAKLTASDGQPGDFFGISVSINGNTIVVGASSANGGHGKAYVYLKPLNGWADMTETAQITASDGQNGDQFGASVSISGKTVVVGAPIHGVGSNQVQGAAYIFVEPANGWASMTQTAELTASNGSTNSGLGRCVSMSGDTAVAGGYFPSGDSSRGAVYVFTESAHGWTNMTETARLTNSKDGGIGSSVSISDGTIATGSPFGGPGAPGEAYVYVRSGNAWKSTITPTAELSASDGDQQDEFGASVSTNGISVLVGAQMAHCLGYGCRRGFGNGIVYAFSEPSGGWVSATQTQELTPADGHARGYFGTSVSVGGSAVMIGAETNTAYAYQYSSNSGFAILPVPGSTTVDLAGVNNLGEIVGSSDAGSFVYSDGGFTAIAVPGATSTYAQGINDAGEVVGYYQDSANVVHGFTELDGSYVTLDYPGTTGSYLQGINNAGAIVGNYCCISTGQIQGFVYGGGVFTVLSFPGSQDTVAFGINNQQVIAGDYCYSPCTQGGGGFLYNNGTFTTVNHPGATGGTSIAGINDNDDLVGEWSNTIETRAFAYWNRTRSFVNFSLGGTNNTSGKGINNSEEIVGEFYEFENGFVYYGFYGHLPGH